MNPDERWRRIESLYHAAQERALDDRAAFLAAECVGDDSLRREVESLLAQPVTHASLPGAGALAQALASGSAPPRVSLVGRRVGAYFIWAPLGAGGMGEVYRARDTTLGRDVALKVISSDLIAAPGARERFEREARLLAALNHPNIAQVYGFEKVDGVSALVMEMVEGPTLRDRVTDGAIPVDEALAVARQIAAALEAAHESGIIHRDLKPENIKVRVDGTVKVLDFGIAKPTGRGSAGADAFPTVDPSGTRQPLILGTPAYMSPEQARGQPVDPRGDVWAFGCVLYEMLTGRAAFARGTVSDTIAAVLDATPAWEHLPRVASPSLVTYLKRCLEKTPRNRVQSIGDMRLALDGVFEPEIQTAPRWSFRQITPWLVVAAAIASVATWLLKPMPAAPPAAVIRSEIALPPDQSFSRLNQESIALSPDGRRLAYVANDQLYVRRMEDAEATPVPGTEASNPYGVVFAPDGNWLAFFSIATGRIVRVPVSGGAHLTVAEVGNRRSIWGLRWNRDNTLCYVDADGIKRVPAAGGPPQLVVATSQGESADAPQLLADGQSLLFAVTDKAGPARWDEASIVIQSIESGRRQVIWEGGSSPVYLPSGHLIFARGAALFAVPFDIERRITTGEPSEVISGVARGGPAFGGPAQISLSDTGTLSYVTGESGRAAPRRFVRVNRAGQAQSVALPSDRYLDPRVSPDGSRVAVAIEKSGNADIWVLDLDGGNRMRLTEPPGTNRYPLWTLDGADVLFALSRAGEYGLYRKPASGHGRAEPLIVDTRRSSWPWSWVPGGRAVALSDFSLIGDTGYDISLLTLEGERVRTPLLSEHVAEAQPGISPNGRWLAYRSDDSGRSEIYVRPFPDVASAKVQVSIEPGTASRTYPVWSRDGGELFYQNGDALMVVTVGDGAAFTPGPARVVTRGHYFGTNTFGVIGRQWDVGPDGTFLMLQSDQADGEVRPAIRLVHSWLAELDQRVPATR